MQGQAAARMRCVGQALLAGCLGLVLAGLATPRTAHAQSDETGGIGGTGISTETGGIGGTGIKPGPLPIIGYGPIQAFGSVFVNGREYEINAHTLVSIDGAPSTVAALRIGDIAHVQGLATGPHHGFAQVITVTNAIAGPVSAVSATGHEVTITVLGQHVIIAGISAPSLQVGQFVQLAAQQRGDGAWVAGRITVLAQPGNTQLVAPVNAIGAGYIAVAGTRFAAPASLTGAVSIGERVIVSGQILADRLQAVSVTPAPVVAGPPGTQVEIQTYFKRAAGNQLIAPDGVTAKAGPVDLQAAGLTPIEVNGRLDAAGSIDIDEVEAAPVAPVIAIPQIESPALPEIKETEPVPDIDIDKLPGKATPDIDAPEAEPPELRPELPDLEAPEIHGPPDD